MNEPNDLYNFVTLKKLIEQPRFLKSYQLLIHLANCSLGCEGSATTYNLFHCRLTILLHYFIALRYFSETRGGCILYVGRSYGPHVSKVVNSIYVCMSVHSKVHSNAGCIFSLIFCRYFFLLSFTCTRR